MTVTLSAECTCKSDPTSDGTVRHVIQLGFEHQDDVPDPNPNDLCTGCGAKLHWHRTENRAAPVLAHRGKLPTLVDHT